MRWGVQVVARAAVQWIEKTHCLIGRSDFQIIKLNKMTQGDWQYEGFKLHKFIKN
jgi:hypothetical protein